MPKKETKSLETLIKKNPAVAREIADTRWAQESHLFSDYNSREEAAYRAGARVAYEQGNAELGFLLSEEATKYVKRSDPPCPAGGRDV